MRYVTKYGLGAVLLLGIAALIYYKGIFIASILLLGVACVGIAGTYVMQWLGKRGK